MAEKYGKTDHLSGPEDDYRNIFEQAGDSIVIHELGGRFLDANKCFCNLVGYSLDEIRLMSPSNLDSPEWAKLVPAHEQEVRIKGAAVFESVFKCKNGRIVPVELNSRVLVFKGKKALLTVARDISERKRAETELRESEERNKIVSTLTTDYIFKLSIEANGHVCMTMATDNYSKATGRTLEEARTPDLWKKFIHADDIERLMALLKKLTMEGGNGEFEGRSLDKEGQERIVQVFARAVPDSDGHPPHAIIGAVKDVTEKRRLEEQFRSLSLQNHAILSSVPDIIMQVDNNKVYAWANPAGLDFFGADVIGKEASYYFEGEQKTYEIIQPLFNGSEEVFYLESRQRRKDGEKRLLAWWCRALKDEKGGVIGALSTARDITERERITAELQNADKLNSIGVLAGGIAHDFNNLLTGIFGYIQIAKLLVRDNSEATKNLEEATEVFKRAKALTQQLLTFSKGGAPIKKEISVSSIIEETTRFALSGSAVSAEINLSDDLWTCHADESQIAQVIDNIVINARQAMPLGGTISISASNIAQADKVLPLLSNQPYVKVSIKDQGIGIQQEILPRIFDPFFTTKQQGSGLGLATAYSIIKKHEGHIDVKSELGKGSTFTLYLPALNKQHKKAATAIEHQRRTGHGRILLMDDEKVICDIGKIFLESIGYSVTVASQGKQAVEMYKKAIAEEKRFDLVILDLIIPGGMGGTDTLNELLKIDPAVKAVASSGYADDPIISHPRSYGFAEGITKPYLRNDFLECVEQALSFASGSNDAERR
jgi:PAS domain S-box-containing protein